MGRVIQSERNHFAVAEEVTIHGEHDRRPDIVLYVNGIALGGLELKKGTHDVAKGIRQAYSLQDERFSSWFFSTIQLVMAGNDGQGLRYGTTGTKEKYFLTWKAENDPLSGERLYSVFFLANQCSGVNLCS